MAGALKKTVLVPVADGSEDLEAVTMIDVLRRAGMWVTVASVGKDRSITCARGCTLVADALLSECTETKFDLIALPGGMPGANHLRDSEQLKQMLLKQNSEPGSYIAAICAAPAVVLATAGKMATCHPNFVKDLPKQDSVANRVVVDGNIITSRGPGTALEFSLKIVEVLLGPEARRSVAAPMVVHEAVL